MVTKGKRLFHAALLWHQLYLWSQRTHTCDALFLPSSSKTRLFLARQHKDIMLWWSLGCQYRWPRSLQHVSLVCHSGSSSVGCHFGESTSEIDLDVRHLERTRKQWFDDHRLLYRYWRERTHICQPWTKWIHHWRSITWYSIQVDICELLSVSLKICIHPRIRLRAVNTIGTGPFSSTIKCQTKSLPPDTPRLECIAITCNSIKLKWTNVLAHQSLSPASTPTTPDATAATPRTITYLIEMEGKDGK